MRLTSGEILRFGQNDTQIDLFRAGPKFGARDDSAGRKATAGPAAYAAACPPEAESGFTIRGILRFAQNDTQIDFVRAQEQRCGAMRRRN